LLPLEVWLIACVLCFAVSTKPISYVKLDLDLHSNRSKHAPPPLLRPTLCTLYTLRPLPSALCPAPYAAPTTYGLEYEVLTLNLHASSTWVLACIILGMHPWHASLACILGMHPWHASLACILGMQDGLLRLLHGSWHASMQHAPERSVSETSNGLERCLRAEGCRLTVT